jgi:pyruvate formate lyase activating enzyme
VDVTELNVREAMLQEADDARIRCLVCERRCRIVDGGLGWCRTRANRGGRLVTLIYGALSSVAVNPIEKKPFFHFYPGSLTLTAGSWSCNFGCPWCQNWPISKSGHPAEGEFVSPEEFVISAERHGCRGTSISFNEPTLSLEWSLDVFRLARSRGLYNTFVTNGYMTPEALTLLVEAGLDAMNVDIKGDAVAVRRYCKGIDVDRVWAACRVARQLGVHIEVTTLIIPTVNDSTATLRGIAERIVNELGSDVPWHTTAYFPAYRFDAPPTPISTLERAWQIGAQAGLDFVYTGNVEGHRGENTICPACRLTLVQRRGFDVLLNRVTHGRCPRCDRGLPGVWG